jgi:hypothetical protein
MLHERLSKLKSTHGAYSINSPYIFNHDSDPQSSSSRTGLPKSWGFNTPEARITRPTTVQSRAEKAMTATTPHETAARPVHSAPRGTDPEYTIIQIPITRPLRWSGTLSWIIV